MYDQQMYLKAIDEVIARGPYQDTWESLSSYTVPEWYRDAKFGIFLHWGIYSVPAFANEWYSRNMYIQGTNAWASLFQEAGAQYVLPVAEHHDGFQMYRSDLSHWNAYEMGPKRDILGELCQSFQKSGLIPGCSTHRIEHWFFMSHGREFESDIHEPMQRGDFYWPAMPEPKNHHDLFAEPTPTDEQQL